MKMPETIPAAVRTTASVAYSLIPYNMKGKMPCRIPTQVLTAAEENQTIPDRAVRWNHPGIRTELLAAPRLPSSNALPSMHGRSAPHSAANLCEPEDGKRSVGCSATGC